ncbi:MAG: N-acetylmuramate 1-kinase [Acidobacteriota bacterium]|nr:N-acetylmuramate 1-kinase [Acidobacteriota bacterium]
MNQSPISTTTAFASSARERLLSFLTAKGERHPERVTALTPDASTREYFRFPWKRKTAIAAVYPEPFDPHFHPYLDVTRLFLEAQLPVPEVLEVDAAAGIIVQEDLGDRQLRLVYESSTEDEAEAYTEQAISLIAKIQASTEKAEERNSIASRLAFDEAKLSWELGFFMEHYFTSLRGEKLSHGEAAELKADMNDVAAELSERPRVLCHRDFHASNLMVDSKSRLRIVDHQDARMGPASYDLVTLLLDRQPEPPSLAEIRAHRLFLLEERRRYGLGALDPDDFAREFRLMTVQRGLKAIGTFSYQTAVSGRGATYEQFINPTFQIVLQAIDWLGRFPALRKAIKARVKDSGTPSST